MKLPTLNAGCPQGADLHPIAKLTRFMLPGRVVGALLLAGVPGALAQTVAINPQTHNFWAGINSSVVLGAGSNNITLKSADTTTVGLSVAGQPGGLTTTWTTNSFTNSVESGLLLAVTNVAAGYYPLTLTAAGGSYAPYSTNVNFYVVPQWAQTNGNSIGYWSDSTKWNGGVAPDANSGVYIEHNYPAPFTNVVDSSRSVQSLIYLGDADDAGYANALNTTITNGATLSVLGTNGMFIGRKASASARPFYVFAGGGTLLVSNVAANFGVVDASANSTRYVTVNMTNLSSFNATVSRFGVGDASLSTLQGAYQGSQVVNFYLAKTNLITALFADNYSAIDFNTSIQYDRNEASANNGIAAGFNLGLTNGIYADSLGVGRGRAVGSATSPFGFFGYPLRFATSCSNSFTPVASAYLRGTNGGRMSLLAIAVDSGVPTEVNNNRGVVDFRGGVVDIQVDQIWLAQNRTNSQADDNIGGLYFDWGNINANTVVAGNMKYTNAATAVVGYLLVGTNGTLNVNSNLVLGMTPAVVTGFETQAGSVSGQIQINNGGTVRANQITVGANSTNNAITLNKGGTLDVTNGVADGSKMLTSLTAAGGALTLHISGNNPIVYVTNLTASAASAINVASVSGISSYPATISVIQYGTATSANNWVGGTAPAGLSVAVANNSGNNSIDLTLTVGSPKMLLWKGYANNIWDNSTYNWLDLNTGLHTNFATLDQVIFDDTALSSTLTVAEDVVPSQSAGGILVSNKLLAYAFTSSGGHILGGASLTEYGTNSLMLDLYAEFSAKVLGGSLFVTGNGTVGAISVAAGASLNNLGTVLNEVTCSGAAINSGTISGNLTVQSPGVVTNNYTVGGGLSLQTNTLFCNNGTMQNIGTATTATNSTLINAGTLYGSSLAVNGTLIDTVQNSAGPGPGSINLGTLTIYGSFFPGGDEITTTKVTDYAITGSQIGNPSGRLQLNTGSKTIILYNSTNTPPNTLVLSQNQGFGPSQANKGINGGTLVISNVGPTSFYAGQTLKVFGRYYDAGIIGNAGLNTTNSYPILQPPTPGPGLVWDLSQLYPGGTIGVISAGSIQINLTNTFTLTSSNLITELSWPSDYINSGWVQQQVVPLTNGLDVNSNWVTVAGSSTNNDILITNALNTANTATFYRFVRP